MLQCLVRRAHVGHGLVDPRQVVDDARVHLLDKRPGVGIHGRAGHVDLVTHPRDRVRQDDAANLLLGRHHHFARDALQVLLELLGEERCLFRGDLRVGQPEPCELGHAFSPPLQIGEARGAGWVAEHQQLRVPRLARPVLAPLVELVSACPTSCDAIGGSRWRSSCARSPADLEQAVRDQPTAHCDTRRPETSGPYLQSS